MSVPRGPKAKVSEDALPWRPRGSESERFAQFCRKFLKVTSGHGVGKPLIIRPWQQDLVASVLDANPVPRLAGWMMPRGQGKSSLLAALSVYKLFTSDEVARLSVVPVPRIRRRSCSASRVLTWRPHRS